MVRTPDDDSPRPSRRERRLRAVVRGQTGPGGEILTWAQAWVSRDGRLHAFAARTLDFVVVTTSEVIVVSTGFFTRRPRRVVYAERHSALHVEDIGEPRGRRLRIARTRRRGLIFELRRDARGADLAAALLACTNREPVSAEVLEQPTVLEQ